MKAFSNDIDQKNELKQFQGKIQQFEKDYLLARKREGRIYSDEIVSKLPAIDSGDKNHNEWKLRQQSTKNLLRYLRKKGKSLKILDIGCGNGWLSNKCAGIPGSYVVAIDVNSGELKQAKRVFGKPNLQFFHADIRSEEINAMRFDIILFAASVQYFQSLEELILDSFKLLRPGGEIHIIDSHFYEITEVDEARKRTKEYYESVGTPGMIDKYFHHEREQLEKFNYQILYKPSRIKQFFRKQNPFCWICIKKEQVK